MTEKHVFTISPDRPFLDTLAETLWARTNGDGFQLSTCLILLPTRRACRALGLAFARIAQGTPVLLPRMRPLGDVDEDEMAFADDAPFDQPPALPPLKRLMLLTQQVKRRDPALSWDQAAQGAEALARFLDQAEIAACDLSRLPALVEEQDLAEHWQKTLLFLDIVTKNWPLILAENGCQDPALRRNAVTEAQAAAWLKAPPSFPVIAAGSTGSVPSTATLLDAVASLPLGAVVLPGLDRAIDNEAWAEIDETHPQHSMKKLLEKMGIERKAVGTFGVPTEETKPLSPPPCGRALAYENEQERATVLAEASPSPNPPPSRGRAKEDALLKPSPSMGEGPVRVIGTQERSEIPICDCPPPCGEGQGGGVSAGDRVRVISDPQAIPFTNAQRRTQPLSPLPDPDARGEGNLPRLTLLSEAMRPANLTEAWHGLKGKLDASAVLGLTSLTLDHPQEEAHVIALRLRAALEEPGKTAALVTADRALAKRVASLLQRWGIRIDDSGGTPLSLSPPGAFLSLVLAAARPNAGHVDLLALLKHPLTACGLSPAACRAYAREAEIHVRRLEPENFDRLKTLLRPLTESAPLPLDAFIGLHIAVAESLAASPAETGAARLWKDEEGEAVAAWLDETREAAAAFPALAAEDYRALFGTFASMKILRSARAAHPRLSILGPLEARLCAADLVVMGGMNEGSWPPDVGFDPWMSRPMRKKFNLPAPEFRIGLSAHDFVQLACAKEALLTRSLRANGTPTVPSRFLLQVDAVLRAAGLNENGALLAPAEPWRAWAQELDAPAEAERKPCARPRPCPPLEVRPKALSVTEITTWLRNPYGIYAKHILKLRKLEELDAALDASDRGTMVHEILEKFAKAYPGALPGGADEKLAAIAREVFARENENPRVRAFWETRFADIAAWFLHQLRQRRENGVALAAAETEGQIAVDGLTLKGRADRVEKLEDGSLVIVDYKTGAVPRKEDVLSGLEPQLQLLALIAARNGFKNIPAASAAACEYWELKGGAAGCKLHSYTEDLSGLVQKAEEGLKNLIAAFKNPATVYEATPRPRLQPRYNDYLHLSRLQEWGKSGEDA